MVWILVNFIKKYDTCDTNKQENKHFWGYLFCVYNKCLQNHILELLLSFLKIIKMLEKMYYLRKKSDTSDTLPDHGQKSVTFWKSQKKAIFRKILNISNI